MGRAPCCEKVGLKRGRWTAEEDNILTKYIQANGEGHWRTLPKNAGLLRCGKSCRLRWINYLRADLKRGNITPEEEKIIVNLHSSFGNRWSLIAGHLPGRTDNEIKNYWNTRLSRKLYSFPGATKESLPTDISKRRGGSDRARRSAMKKHKNAASGTLEMSLVRPESVTTSEMVEATSEEQARLLGKVEGQVERIPITGMASRSLEPKVDTRSLGMHGSCLDSAAMILDHCGESKSAGLAPDKDSAISAFLFCPVQKRENEALGPYEWLDCEMTPLSYIFQSRVEDPSGGVDHKERRENGVVDINERANAGLGTEKETVNEGESSVPSSNADGELFNCSSSTPSRFDDEWFDWDWVGGVECHDQLNVWNEGEQIFTCSWEAGKGDNQ